MGTIPVANPTPPRRLRFPRREIAIGLALASIFGVLVVAAAFAWPTGPKVDPAGWITVGQVDDFAVNEPVRIKEHRVWIVRLAEQEFVALSTRDPYKGCTVPWRPDFEFMGRKGWFRDPCHNSTYDINGTRMFGPSPRNLDRFPLRIEGGTVQVDVSKPIMNPATVSP